MQQEIIFKKGVLFKIKTKTEYETLPFEPGNYEVVFDHYFDGEKCHNNSYIRSSFMTVMFYENEYEVDRKLAVFSTKRLHELLDNGYITIVNKLF